MHCYFFGLNAALTMVKYLSFFVFKYFIIQAFVSAHSILLKMGRTLAYSTRDGQGRLALSDSEAERLRYQESEITMDLDMDEEDLADSIQPVLLVASLLNAIFKSLVGVVLVCPHLPEFPRSAIAIFLCFWIFLAVSVASIVDFLPPEF